MKTLALMALFGGDPDHAKAFQDWVKVHPLVCESDGGCEIRCTNGSRPRSTCVAGEYRVTCDAKDGGR